MTYDIAALDLPLRDEQQMLRDSVQRFLADNARPGWRDLVESLGLAGVAVPEAHGGFGGGAIDVAVVMAELGPALAGADWLSHTAAAMLLARAAPDHAALADLATGDRRAAMVSTLVAVRRPQDPEPLIAVGRVQGEITTERRGEGGFGFDPVMFLPEFGQTFAELPTEVKNAHSHRGRSSQQMLQLLRTHWL